MIAALLVVSQKYLDIVVNEWRIGSRTVAGRQVVSPHIRSVLCIFGLVGLVV